MKITACVESTIESTLSSQTECPNETHLYEEIDLC